MNITEKEWLAVYGELDAMTKNVKGILFNAYKWKWNPSDEYVREYVWDQTLKRLESYRPGPASPATYVQKYVPKDVVRCLVKEYHAWQAQVDCDKIEDLPDFKEDPA